METRLKYLQEKRLAIIEPLRIMPQPQTDEDRSADASKGARDLLKSVEGEIEQVQKDLDAAREELVATETRFYEESARP
jgi:predicted  nucleic acid-binding Zn-ribbon protein